VTSAPGPLAWLRLARAPAVFTALSNIVAAHLVATGGRVEWSSLLLLSLASCCLYVGGMMLNDWFDRDVDARERPERPIPSGVIAPGAARAAGLTALLAGVAFAAPVGIVPFAIAALLALAILAYDAWSKDTLVGPVNMGACRWLNWLLGLSVVPPSMELVLFGVPVFFYVLAVTLVSREEVRAQSRGTVVLAFVAMHAAVLSFSGLFVRDTLVFVACLVFFGAPMIGLAMALRNFTPGTLQRTVTWLLLGIVPLDALLVISTGQWLGACVVLLLMVPGRVLGRWMSLT
jgi:4-hydroxybenzoate polyprenyltransferase